jgi:hypothetical protein
MYGKLLQEFNVIKYDRQVIVENQEQKKPIVLKALMQRADAVNQNGRIYPRNILQREVEKYKKAIAENRATGEADHPDSSVINLKNVSHIVRDIWWDNDEVWGTVEILNTPAGKIVQELMSAGVAIGISSRGVGDVIKNETGNDVVEESFSLIAFDLVSEPSTHHAWLQEGKDLTLDEYRKTVSKTDRVRRLVEEILKN